MIKVLITLPVKIGFDGMTKQVLSYGKYMDRTDLEIDLLSCRGYDPDMKQAMQEANFNNIYRLEYRDTNQIKYFFNLLKIMRKRKYDVIHANGQSATLAIEMLAALLTGCKVRISHSHNSQCNHIRVHKLLYPLFKLTCNDAIACSKEAGDWLFNGRSYWVLNNGINIDDFKFNPDARVAYREKLGIGERDIAVGNVAAFEPKKNQSFLIDVFEEIIKEHPNYKLFLWGIDGSSRETILEKIKQKKLEKNVIYKGTTNEINNYLNAMDIMLLPSWYEGFPVTVVEWQASNLPCLVSDTVTKDCNITGNVKFLPIDNGVKPWADSILKIDNDIDYRFEDSCIIALQKSGFDIKKNVEELKLHYISKLGRIR